jgi:hypothetical protein
MRQSRDMCGRKRGCVRGPITGEYARCKTCHDLYPKSALLASGECRDCAAYDPRDHDD